jgi:hypothetical protein
MEIQMSKRENLTDYVKDPISGRMGNAVGSGKIRLLSPFVLKWGFSC